MVQKITDILKNNTFLYTLLLMHKKRKEKRKKIIVGNGNFMKKEGVNFNLKYNIIGDNNYIETKKYSIVSNIKIFIDGSNNHLIIGRGVKYSGGSFRFGGDNCLIEIGENTTVQSANLQAIESNRKIIIGSDCMFSLGIDILTSDFHPIIDCQTGQRINESKDVIIGNHVWIGAFALLLKGITIEDNCIIGAKSIVTKNIPNNTMVAGSPAKILKTNINWER